MNTRRLIMVYAAIVALLPVAAVRAITITTFTGVGDLDLSGNFAYALNTGADSNPGPIVVGGLALDPVFLDNGGSGPVVGPAGVSYTNPEPTAANRDLDPLGASYSFGDANLETVLNSTAFGSNGAGTGPSFGLTLLTGWTYKLQIILAPTNTNDRIFDVVLDGSTVVDDLNLKSGETVDGQTISTSRGVLISETFVASDTSLDLFFSYAGTGNGPLIPAITLEQLAAPVPEPNTLALAIAGAAACRLGSPRRRKRDGVSRVHAMHQKRA